MPEKYIGYNFGYKNSTSPPEFNGIETVDCPRCNYRIPVREDLVDYKMLYESLLSLSQKQLKSFENFLKDMEEEMPEIKIYLHNKKVELINRIHEINEIFKNNNNLNSLDL